ncbi:MAG: hypothetical protein AAF384_08220, partial [Pseudomonadota bacterium]
ANLSGATIVDYAKGPVIAVESQTPKVMLQMSKDERWWDKIYTDYDDLNGDGALDTTYNNSINYYGYFDPDKCYDYAVGSFGGPTIEYFEPAAFTTNHYCDTVAGEWSGNFLNWATMTRMDVLRKMLYGGKRHVDTATDTVLERAYLPTDAHSFAKYYNGDDLGQLTPFNFVRTDNTNGGDGDGIDDIDEGLTLCNTSNWPLSGSTIQSIASQDVLVEPLFRAVAGNFQLWSSNERYQCEWDNTHGVNRGTNANNSSASGIFAGDDSPNEISDGLQTGGFGPEFNVYVRACVPGLVAAIGDHEDCRDYPNGNQKPTGVLQEYGEDEQLHFGLLSGSYEKNISGGVLRKSVGDLSAEINFSTDGTFTADPASTVPTVGIIRSIDKFRVFGYRYGDNSAGVYFGSPSGDNCGFQLAGITEGDCNSWGNPLSEMYAESVRYFAGLTETPAFSSIDDNFIPGLDEDVFSDPLDPNNFCVGLNVLMMNTSSPSYDTDSTSVFTDVGAPPPNILTQAVGDLEGITGNDFFIGSNGATTDELCNAKTVSNLGDASGFCPEDPTLESGYRIAGMAHYSRTNDVHPGFDGEQTINTIALQFPTAVPKIDIPIGPTTASQTIRFVPQHRLNLHDLAGRIVDFRVVRAHTEIDAAQVDLTGTPASNQNYGRPTVLLPNPTNGTGIYHGKFYIDFEDSGYGADFDQDLWGMLDYVVNTNNNPATVSITTDTIAESTAREQLFGFVLEGTTQDGFHSYSGIERAQFDDPDPTIIDCNDDPTLFVNQCEIGDPARTETFIVGASAASFLPDPLFLAAKYGGFEDSNGNLIPDLASEWDRLDVLGNSCGAPPCDGIPDNYASSNNPAAMAAALRMQLNRILSNTAAQAILANEGHSPTLSVQNIYSPVRVDALGNEASWMGDLPALFVDDAGLLREDADQDGALDGYNVDHVVETFYDDVENRHRIRRYFNADPLLFDGGTAIVNEDELDSLAGIWNARENLSALTNVLAQRPFTAPSNNGRYITTWLDTDYDNIVDPGEVVPFDSTTFDGTNFGWLDQLNEANADKLVDYVRGEEQPGFRSRVVDYNNDGTAEVMRLADAPNAKPVILGAPAAEHPSDPDYALFKTQYQNRRSVTLLGTNDGQIRAFNNGFYDPLTKSFALNLTSEVTHPLGGELWSYVPKNLLGHLQWLTDPSAVHVPFVDASVQTFDAKIFLPSPKHPFGWGTILVATMGFGGGNDANGITLDTGADGPGGGNDVATKSAIVILDITDTESPPNVLAELSPPNLQYTTSKPTVVSQVDPLALLNEWHLVVGSGPTDLDGGSNQDARLFAYDLVQLVNGVPSQVSSGPFFSGQAIIGGAFNQLTGDLTSIDADNDLRSEAIYFGTAGDSAGIEGSLHRMSIAEAATPSGWGNSFELLLAGQPIVQKPTAVLRDGNVWVIANTGRVLASQDKASVATQSLYAVIDPNPLNDTFSSFGLSPGGLLDLTNSIAFTDETVDIDGDLIVDTTQGALAATIVSSGGWRRDHQSNALDPAERALGMPKLIGDALIATAFTPDLTLCGMNVNGATELLAINLLAGVPPTAAGYLGTEACGGACPGGVDILTSKIALGGGALLWPPTRLLAEIADIALPASPTTTVPATKIPMLPLIALLSLSALLLGFARSISLSRP